MINKIRILVEFKALIQLYHWKAINESYSIHIALDEYYKTLSKQLDRLIESYQGKYGIINLYIGAVKIGDISMLNNTIEAVVNKLNENKSEDTWIENQIDEIIADIYKLKYKLVNLN